MSDFSISWQHYSLQLRDVFTISRSSRTEVPVVFFKLEKDGLAGYGEASPNTRYDESPEKVEAVFSSIKPEYFDGIETPEQVEAMLDGLNLPVNAARFAIEMAWLDWWAKSQNQPLWKLWGAESPVGPVTSFTIGIDTVETMVSKVKEAEAYPVYKVKLGTDHDREIIEAIRNVTDKPVRVDANEGWTTVEQAKVEIDYLTGKDIELIEQPMPSAQLEDMIKLKEVATVPLAADESFIGDEDLTELSQAFHIINIKLMKIASLVKAKRVLEKANDLGIQVMVGCMIESSLGNAAGAVLGLWADYVDLDGHVLISNDPFSGLTINKEGRIQLSEKPGFGVELVNQFHF